MIKNRKEGVIYLHWCALTSAAVGVYLGWLAFAKISPGFHGVQGLNVVLYLLGVVIASFWLHHGMYNVGHRLGDMGLIESIRYSRHQLSRFIVVLFTIAFLIKDSEVSRKFLFGYILLMALVLTAANVYFPKIIVRLFFRKMLMRTVLVAKSEEVMKLHDMMAAREHLGIKIIGWVGEGELDDSDQMRLPKLGELPDLRHVLMEHAVVPSRCFAAQFFRRKKAGRSHNAPRRPRAEFAFSPTCSGIFLNSPSASNMGLASSRL